MSTASAALAETHPGVTEDSVHFGQTAAFEGPAAALGQGMRLGLKAAFEEANRAGGVKGRTLKLTDLDDGYEPEQAAANTRALIDEHKVFALIGTVGTPTAKVIQPLATSAGVPLVGPFTGAGFLRAKGVSNVINVRASYGAEADTWIEHLTRTGHERIAILFQDDGFGQAGRTGVLAAMKKRGLSLVAEGKYRRNTVAVKTALLQIRRAKPDAVVMVGAYRPCAEFITLARQLGLDATFMNISFVGSAALAKRLGAGGFGVMVSQVVPFPNDTSLSLVKQYHAALKAVDAQAEPGFVSLEGYMVGRLAIMALESIDGPVTRATFLDAIYSRKTFDLGGVTLTYSPGDNQGMDAVYLTRIGAGGRFEAVTQGGEGQGTRGGQRAEP
ncbi:MAG: ABC transporter substrate-binding protein [Bradymonadia bacterium]